MAPIAPRLTPNNQRLANEAVRRMGRDGEKLEDLPPIYKRAFIDAHAAKVGPERARAFHAGFGVANSAIDENRAKASLGAQVNQDVKDRYEVVKAHRNDSSFPIRTMARATEALSFNAPMKANDMLDTAHQHYAQRAASGDKSWTNRAAGTLVGLADSVGVNRVMDPRSTVAQTQDGMMDAALSFGAGPVIGKIGKVAAGSRAGVALEAKLATTSLGARTQALGGALSRPLGSKAVRAADSGPTPSFLSKRTGHGSHPSFKPTLERLKAGGMVEVPPVGKKMPISKDLRTLMADLTVETGNEVGLIRLANGKRVLRMGTPREVPIREYDGRLIAHTHPSGTLKLSTGDVEVLEAMNKFGGVPQKSTVLIDPTNGGVKAGQSNGALRMAPSGGATIGAGYGR